MNCQHRHKYIPQGCYCPVCNYQTPVRPPAHQRIHETDSTNVFHRAECDCGWLGPWEHDRARAAADAVIHNRTDHVARTVAERMESVKQKRSAP